MELLEQLNPQQREAVEATEGPLLILAGAGSGKTRVITYRIAYLMEKAGVPPDSILAVTFTNKAAREMAERVETLVGGAGLARPLICTFHSFCVRVLRRDIEAMRTGNTGYRKDFAIFDENDQLQVVKSAMKRLGIDDRQLTPRAVLSRISWAKNHMLDPQEVYLQSGDSKTERIAHIFEIYRKELRKANALDFDDLLLEAVRLVKSNNEVRERYNRRFQYILIDEYQDTNRPQYELMKQLAGSHHNICVVGDEDQSIYSWRGADINNILEFEHDFPEVKVIHLEQNYRSTSNILGAASAVVAKNKKRKGKTLWTSRQGGTKIGFYQAPDGENESLFIADAISRHVRAEQAAGREAKVAVLYRTNSQSRFFEESLRRYNLRYQVVGGFSFYQRAEIKDLVSFLKFINNLDDSIALLRIINTPPRGIGKGTLELLERLALETGLTLWAAVKEAIRRQLLPPRALAALKNFAEIIADARVMLEGKLVSHLDESILPSDKSEIAQNDDGIEAYKSEAQEDQEDPEDEDVSFDFSNMLSFSALSYQEPTGMGSPNGASGNSSEDRARDAKEISLKHLASPGHLPSAEEAVPGFRAPGGPATIPEVIKFLIDRTGYIKQLEEEGTPESIARIENLHELVNAARDSRDRGETLTEFLDHAALVSDVDQYDARAQITLMTLHAAKGLEFPLVFLAGLEEGLFPHSRTLNQPDDVEEERRLCYVGMTRAMNTLIITNARYRRRYASDMPEPTVPSRFLEEIPEQLIEDLGEPDGGEADQSLARDTGYGNLQSPPNRLAGKTHYSYEDEDQSASLYSRRALRNKPRNPYPATTYNSIENIAEFFASRGRKFTRPKVPVAPAAGKTGFRPGQQVRHPKYGEGIVYKREGEGEDAKITVQFSQFGLKKLVEKFAQLERC